MLIVYSTQWIRLWVLLFTMYDYHNNLILYHVTQSRNQITENTE